MSRKPSVKFSPPDPSAPLSLFSIMKTVKVLSLLAFCGTLGLLSGCVSESESHLVTTAPPPEPGTDPAVQQVVVVSAGQQVAAVAVAAPANSYIVIQEPPAPQAPQASRNARARHTSGSPVIGPGRTTATLGWSATGSCRPTPAPSGSTPARYPKPVPSVSTRATGTDSRPRRAPR